MKIKTRKIKHRNWLAKFAHRCGAGRHIDKQGDRAPRVRQKRQWKREISDNL